MSVNKVILLGRLGSDPEVKMTASGKQVATVSLATSEKYTDRTGARQEKTEWHRCVLWEKKAELAAKYLRKGHLVYFEGMIRTRSWDDPNGQKRYSTEIMVDTITFCEKGASSGDGGQQSPHPSQAPQAHYGQNHPTVDLDEDVPF